MQLQGVLHEFSTVPGVIEDVTDIVLNVKGISLKMEVDGPKRLRLNAKGPTQVTAAMIELTTGIEIMNPEHHICTLDKGAIAALRNGNSLLPAGVSQVAGSFQRGEAVILINKDGLEIGRGLTAYSDADAKKIIGHKSDEIEKLLGYRGRDEMIHRDDMILLESKINDN